MAAYNPPAAPSGLPHHLRAQTSDTVDTWSDWTTLFTLQSPKGRYTYDGQPPIIGDITPANGSAITDFYHIHRRIPVPSAAWLRLGLAWLVQEK